MSGNRMVAHWNLRQRMAEKGMFATTDLVEPLHARGVELSRQMIHRVVTKTPQRINMDLLAALCDILDCSPNDLIEPVARQHPMRATGTGDTDTASVKGRTPRRAEVTRRQ